MSTNFFVQTWRPWWFPKMTSIFQGQPPKTRPKFQSTQGAPFGFQIHKYPEIKLFCPFFQKPNLWKWPQKTRKFSPTCPSHAKIANGCWHSYPTANQCLEINASIPKQLDMQTNTLETPTKRGKGKSSTQTFLWWGYASSLERLL